MRSDIQFIQQPEIDAHHYERGDTVRLTTANLRHEYQLDVYIFAPRRQADLRFRRCGGAQDRHSGRQLGGEKRRGRWRSAREKHRQGGAGGELISLCVFSVDFDEGRRSCVGFFFPRRDNGQVTP